jgi:SAM-dependent methyltransferase
MTPRFSRPEPILRHRALSVDRNTSPMRAAERLCEGEALVVADSYSTGAEILAQLKTMLHPPTSGASFEVRQAFQRTYRETAMRLLAPISKGRLALTGAHPIGFLEELYSELSDFFLPLLSVQELRGSWARYTEGVHYAVLGHRIHPFYGTYSPTRVSHLELFGTWLSQHKGGRRRAVDVGTGCGVLALMLCRAGFEGVWATDINVNAIESLTRDLARLPSRPPIEPMVADLLGEQEETVDLIVFNPPWIAGRPEGMLDQALTFGPRLFTRFFDQALGRLKPDGRLVLVFSNVVQLLQPDVAHPVLAELERGRYRLVQKMQRKVKPLKGSGRRTKEKVEVWELAVNE